MSSIQDIKVAVDNVVFGYQENTLKVLLIQQTFGLESTTWALPGGLVQANETLETAALRELQEETGVDISYMEQLYTYGAPERDHRGRVISVAYMALVNIKDYSVKADTDALDSQWFNIEDLPPLAFDHKDILQDGLQRLRAKIKYEPIGFELLNKEFPFSDIEQLYQTILNRKIDRRNFRKKLLSFGFLTETDKLQQNKKGRPGKLFTFNKAVYNTLKTEKYHLEFVFA